jgi:hypothetical protein
LSCGFRCAHVCSRSRTLTKASRLGIGLELGAECLHSSGDEHRRAWFRAKSPWGRVGSKQTNVPGEESNKQTDFPREEILTTTDTRGGPLSSWSGSSRTRPESATSHAPGECGPALKPAPAAASPRVKRLPKSRNTEPPGSSHRGVKRLPKSRNTEHYRERIFSGSMLVFPCSLLKQTLRGLRMAGAVFC